MTQRSYSNALAGPGMMFLSAAIFGFFGFMLVFPEIASTTGKLIPMVVTLKALEGSLEGGSKGDGEFDGPRLRRLRMHRGIELDEIAEITKVSSRYLRCIEEEAFDGLPAPVYVRGFVTAYARTIGLNPQRVVASYMLRLEEGTKESGRASRGRP